MARGRRAVSSPGCAAGRFRRRIKRPRCGRRSHLPLTTHRTRRDLRRFRKPLLINGYRRRIPIIANGWRCGYCLSVGSGRTRESRNCDGAWGWEKGVPSDALTTGLAIYVLAKARAGVDSSVFRDARKWLLASQQPDGSWLTPAKNFTRPTVPEQMKVRDEIYHYWGTAWATIGLLETLGKSGS